MKSNFIERRDIEKGIWVSPHDLIGIPGMPSSVAGIHYRANTQGWSKRKKEGVKGGKAVEYDVLSFPESERSNTMSYLGFIENIEEKSTIIGGDQQQSSLSLTSKLVATLATLVAELEPDEAHRALKLLSKGGLSTLMPMVFSEQQLYSLMGASQQSIQTLMMLEALPSETRKEILAKYGLAEQTSPVAPQTEEPHNKKAS